MHILGSNPGDAVFVHERIFANMRLFASAQNLWISVSAGVKGDDFEEMRLEACSITDNQCRNPMAEGNTSARNQISEKALTHYTYVALFLEDAQLKIIDKKDQKKVERYATLRWSHHITLAYLPFMSTREMASMEAALNDLIQNWLDTEPKYRPSCLLTSRSVVVGRRLEDIGNDHMLSDIDRWPNTDIYTSYHSDFINMEWDKLCMLIDSGLLIFAHEPKEITKVREVHGNEGVTPQVMKAVCARYHDRDLGRVNKARAMEEEGRPKYGLHGKIEVLLRDSKVGKTSELKTLLHYLREHLVLKWGVHHMLPSKDLGLHSEHSWHVTPQTNALEATRRGLCTPEFANYVESFWTVHHDQ